MSNNMTREERETHKRARRFRKTMVNLIDRHRHYIFTNLLYSLKVVDRTTMNKFISDCGKLWNQHNSEEWNRVKATDHVDFSKSYGKPPKSIKPTKIRR